MSRRGSLAIGLWLAVGGALAVLRLCTPSESGWATVLNAVAALASVVVILAGQRANRPRRALPWYLLAGYCGCQALGAAAVWAESRDGRVPFPSFADVVFLSAYPLLAAGLLLLIRGLSWRRDRGGILDALTISTAIGLTMWLVFMRPLVDDTAMALGPRLVSLAYPAADLLMISVLIRLLLSPGTRSAAFWQLSAGLVVLACTDVYWLFDTSFAGTYSLSTDPGYILAEVLVAAAALYPSMTAVGSVSEAPPDNRVTRRQVLLIGAVCLLTPALLFPQGLLRGGRVDWLATGIGCMVMFGLVMARMYVLVREVQDQATHLEMIAHVDALTGIPNRRAWDVELTRGIDTAARHNYPIVVALLDLDLFKRYNDTYGHQSGDLLLQEAATAWRTELRGGDLLARYGGEEFGVLLSHTRLTDSERVMERLLAVTPRGQTFSAGLAQWIPGETALDVLRRADEALYSAKRAGRNRWHVSGARSTELTAA